ncbi:MAG: FapA family protein [Treponemataceae bacterium]|nr:FapA family protein [Treponemataceae bacterium]
MVTLEQIRADLAKSLKADQTLEFVEVRAETLEEALADAATQLQSRVPLLEYEVLEQGTGGFMGLMKKPWFIRAYENAEAAKKEKKKAVAGESGDIIAEEEEVNLDKDGMFYVHYFDSQICLKVVPPVGSGSPVLLKEVLLRLKRSDTIEIEENKVKECVKNGTDGQYVPVGLFEHNPVFDSLITVDISSDEMRASITVSAPSMGGAEVSPFHIKRVLETQGVVCGISEEKINDFVDTPVFGIPFVVAEAPHPVDGRNAYIAYNFETDRSKLKLKESENGQVDYKELNRIQNVVEGQPLAQKMPAERGKAGKTLFGRYLEAKNGKDIPMPLGKNVVVDSDGRTILAATNGQVLLINDKIHVEPIMEVDSVSIKTGNITFLGTVIVKGNVDDGFKVKASGNIEVYGTVGKSILEADGDVIVSLGIMGRDEGYIRAGKSLWAKFIQNTQVDVEEYIIVTDGIINSQVTCNKKILLQGKRAAIIGGHLFATEEIHSKTIGSNGGGSETVLEVGYDPKAKRHLDELMDRQTALAKELDELDLNISTLENQKKIRKNLSPEKTENLAKLTLRKNEVIAESEEISEEIQQIQAHLRELKVIGKISASGTVYAGVKLYIRDVKEEIRADVKSVTFFYENGFVRHGKYEPPTAEDMKRAPDGYSTN